MTTNRLTFDSEAAKAAFCARYDARDLGGGPAEQLLKAYETETGVYDLDDDQGEDLAETANEVPGTRLRTLAPVG